MWFDWKVAIIAALFGVLIASAFAQHYTETIYPRKVVTANVVARGDFTLGDDLAVTGDATVGGTLDVAGETTLGVVSPDMIDQVGYRVNATAIVDYVVTATPRAVTAAESGYTFTVSTADAAAEVEFQLPTAVAGLQYTFSDLDATASADLVIQAASGDIINAGAAGKEYLSGGDVVAETVTLRAVNATNWVVIGEKGTWAADDS